MHRISSKCSALLNEIGKKCERRNISDFFMIFYINSRIYYIHCTCVFIITSYHVLLIYHIIAHSYSLYHCTFVFIIRNYYMYHCTFVFIIFVIIIISYHIRIYYILNYYIRIYYVLNYYTIFVLLIYHIHIHSFTFTFYYIHVHCIIHSIRKFTYLHSQIFHYIVHSQTFYYILNYYTIFVFLNIYHVHCIHTLRILKSCSRITIRELIRNVSEMSGFL